MKIKFNLWMSCTFVNEFEFDLKRSKQKKSSRYTFVNSRTGVKVEVFFVFFCEQKLSKQLPKMGALISIVLVALAVARILKTPADDYHPNRNCTFVGFCNFGHGTLECFNPHEVYSGNWWLGKRSGFGMQTNEKGLYQGEWKMNEMHGLGFMLLKNGTFEIGMFKNGVILADSCSNSPSIIKKQSTGEKCQLVALSYTDCLPTHTVEVKLGGAEKKEKRKQMCTNDQSSTNTSISGYNVLGTALFVIVTVLAWFHLTADPPPPARIF